MGDEADSLSDQAADIEAASPLYQDPPTKPKKTMNTLQWEKCKDRLGERGYLPHDPGTTLFLLGGCCGRFKLLGAFRGDAVEDKERFTTPTYAKAAAQASMDAWVEKYTEGWKV